jgi:hypothetical protein
VWHSFEALKLSLKEALKMYRIQVLVFEESLACRRAPHVPSVLRKAL